MRRTGDRFTSTGAACPTRYIHSHAGILHADDYDNGVKLLVEALKRLDAKTVAGLRP